MSGAKHTPGPWSRNGNMIEGKDFETIAYVTAYNTLTPRQLANARLIAAAPELLEAAEAEEEWRAREAAGAIDPEWDYERMVGDKRRAAIAKATGEAA